MESKSATLILDQLIASALNVRQADKLDGVSELAANIEQLGILQPLSVRKVPAANGHDAAYEVIDGERRLAALRKLKEEGTIDGAYIVPVLLRDDDDATASAVSLSANIMRLPLHPADQYQAFARLKREGKGVQEIAKLFSLKKKEVEKTLALGNLAPAVLDAYRNNEHVDEEVARLLTRISDHRQMEIIGQIKKGKLLPWQIKTLLENEQIATSSPLVQFVGLKEYESRGGVVTRDLFGGSAYCTDRKLLLEIAKEKGDTIRAQLIDEGWAWAEYVQELPANAVNNWQRIYAEEEYASAEDEALAAKLSAEKDKIEEMGDGPEDPNDPVNVRYGEIEDEEDRIRERMVAVYPKSKMKKCGVIIDFNHREVFLKGFRRPEDVKLEKKKEKARDAQAKDGPTHGERVLNGTALSSALQADMDGVLTDAVRIAISDDPQAADALLILSLLDNARFTYTTSIKTGLSNIRVETPHHAKLLEQVIAECGLPKAKAGGDRKLLPAYEAITKLSKSKRDKLRSALIANHLDKISGGDEHIDIVATDVSRIWKPDAAFFERLNKSQMFVAFKEAGVSLPPDNMKKSELVTFAVRELGKVGWLPPTLRSKLYTGPVKKPKAKRAA
jgi:ParB family chromosome partitioning protein